VRPILPKSKGLRWLAFATFLACCTSLLFAACSSQEPGGTSSGTGGLPPTTNLCDHPNPGCGCDAVGATADCGRVEETVGSYVMCSMGKTTCDGTHWGTCQGDSVVIKSKSFTSGGGLHVNALGSPGACGAANPCDPYCNQVVDDPCGGLDASGLNSADCGLTVNPGGSNLCYCDEPSGGSAALYGNLSGPLKGNTGACTGGTSDNCQHDYKCNNPDGGAGTCTPYAISGYNGACTNKPDFTLGMGCLSGGTTQELEVCNRSLVNAATGTLYIAVGSSNPASAATTCPFAGPAILATGTSDGYCTVNLATTAIGPGQCITVNTATSCTASGGGALNFGGGGGRYLVVNPSTTVLPTTIVPGYAPLSECDACNNYSAENPGLPSASACTSEICGTVCGGLEAGVGDGGDAGCHTTVVGTVFDPGANVPLPAIAVYEPSGALTAFPAGVTCDTCTSLLSPYVSSTFSDLSGNFALEVDSTSPKVVFQTGRWRRQISLSGLTACVPNTITVASDCKYPGKNCLTRLPQTQAEGDIPSIAIVTGKAEPFECTIAKYMGGTDEMGPAGSGKRLQLFQDNGIASASTLIASGTTAAVGVPPLPPLTGNSPKVSKQTGISVQIRNLSGLTSADVGKTITLAGAANGGNNGSFVITAVTSSTRLLINNAAAVNETGGGGFTWSIPGNGITTLNISGLTGRTAADVGNLLILSGAASGGNNGSFNVTSFINATTLAINNSSAIGPDANNGAITWKLYSAGAGAALPDAPATLWPSQAAVNAFDEVILQCGGGTGEVFDLGKTTNAAELAGQTYFYNWLQSGGRVFMNHYSANGLLLPVANGGHAIPPFNNTSTWNSPIGSNKISLNTKVAPNITPAQPQADFATWLTNQSYYGGGVLTTPQGVTDEAYNPTANSFEWLRGVSNNNWGTTPGGNITSVFSFDSRDGGIVPTLAPDGGAGSGCGRGVMSAMHVDIGRGTGTGSFPAECDFGPDLSANEGTFDYLFFTLSSCAIGGPPIASSAPPPPPAPPSLPGGVTFTRDFHAVCPNGTLPIWQLFNWQASVPFGTSVDFTAQTAPDNGSGAPGTYAPVTPFAIGSASSTTSTWTTQQYAAPPLAVGPAACTVDQHLTGNNGCPGPGNLTSQEWLRVTMKFNVAGPLSPTLTNWEQLFDCVPAK
jgi:hypothetical protein